MLLGGSLPHISAITDGGQTAVSTAEATGTAWVAPVTREHTAGPWMAQSIVPAAKRPGFPGAEQADFATRHNKHLKWGLMNNSSLVSYETKKLYVCW